MSELALADDPELIPNTLRLATLGLLVFQLGYQLYVGCVTKTDDANIPKKCTPPTNTKHEYIHAASRIVCSKLNDSRNGSAVPPNRVDAILQYICSLPSVSSMVYNGVEFIPTTRDPIELMPGADVFFRVLQMDDDGKGGHNLIKFELLSDAHNVTHLQAFIDTCVQYAERRARNKLGNQLYFFDQVVERSRGSYRDPLPKDYLVFRKMPFSTTRTFDNVFFEDRDVVRDRLEFFLNRKDWYEAKGIPHSLGIMGFGEPGTGKTSTTKAIANRSKRHVINVHLSDIKTNTQLKHLFYSDEVYVMDSTGRLDTLCIPISERVYVIEDIDAMESVVLRRDATGHSGISAGESLFGGAAANTELNYADFMSSGDLNVGTKLGKPSDSAGSHNNPDPVDLSTLLNILDGTLETPGRILVVTTNFPKRLDQALIRPGRIDLMVEFKKCTREILVQMLNSFYSEQGRQWSMKDFSFDPLLDYKWTPAEVNQILFRHFHDPEAALIVLREPRHSA